jgi:hypothetical protein
MTKRKTAPPSVAEVVGRTAQSLRGERKLELVARAARGAGLNWGTGRIADLEAGRVSPTLPTLFLLCVAFSDLLDRPVGLADFLAGDGLVMLTAEATVKLPDLRAALAGQSIGIEPVGHLLDDPVAAEAMKRGGIEVSDIRANVRKQLAANPHGPKMISPRARKVRDSFLEADYRMAHGLGLEFGRAADVMHRLWGRSFSDERDRRGGPGANAQKRGRISRELKQELSKAVGDGDD